LNAAINAAEHYMKALRLAPPDDKKHLDSKCKELILKAEKIKVATDWKAAARAGIFPALRPVSTRNLTTREEIIILEGAKLNGFIFPPWSRPPTQDEFVYEGPPFTYVGLKCLGCRLLTGFRDTPDLHLSDCQRDIFAGWKRPRELLQAQVANSTDGPIVPSMLASGQTDLVQDVLTDCSVVASLCATTSRAERGLGQV
jgi:hypothetical protein